MTEYTVIIHMTNGSTAELPARNLVRAYEVARDNISYSGGHIAKVFLAPNNNSHEPRKVHDNTWTDLSNTQAKRTPK